MHAQLQKWADTIFGGIDSCGIQASLFILSTLGCENFMVWFYGILYIKNFSFTHTQQEVKGLSNKSHDIYIFKK